MRTVPRTGPTRQRSASCPTGKLELGLPALLRLLLIVFGENRSEDILERREVAVMPVGPLCRSLVEVFLLFSALRRMCIQPSPQLVCSTLDEFIRPDLGVGSHWLLV